MESCMGTLGEDIAAAAEWIAKALASSGYTADFSIDSLREIDRFFDEHSRSGKPVRGGLLDENLGSRLFAMGSYVGEVIRRARGGAWRCDDDDPQGEMNVALVLPDGTRLWPVQRAMKRFQNGPEDGIHVYGVVLAGGEEPKVARRKPWWRFW
jgi:hypothetical protein